MYKKITSCFIILVILLSTIIPPQAQACWAPSWWGAAQKFITNLMGSINTAINGYTSNRPGNLVKGDPVSLHDGDFVYDHTDLTIPGRGMPLEIKRDYRAQAKYNGRFGLGWEFSFNKRVVALSDGSVDYYDGEGGKNHFSYIDGTHYIPPAEVFDTLVQNSDGTFALTKKDATKYNFDANGMISQIVDRNGNTMTFTYDPAGKLPLTGVPLYSNDTATPRLIAYQYELIKITDPLGRDMTLSYDSTGHLSQISDFSGRVVKYNCDSMGHLVSVTDPGNNTIQYTYDPDRHLKSIIDAKGQAYLTNTYNALEQVIAQEYGNSTMYYSYDTANHITHFTDGNGNQWVYYFDANGDPVKTIDPQGNTTTTIFDSNNRMMPMLATYPEGNSVLYGYDSKGNTTRVTKRPKPGSTAPNIVITFTYDPTYNFIKTATDANGNVTAYNYDANGNLTGIVYPAPANGGTQPQVSFTYDQHGQLITSTAPTGTVTKYDHDSNGYISAITADYGTGKINAVTGFTYDAVGNVLSVTDSLNHTTNLSYDALNRLTQVSDALNHLTKYVYDANSNLIELDKQSDDAGTQWQIAKYVYDILDRLTTVTTGLIGQTGETGQTTALQYDNNGNKTKVIDANNKSTAYAYNGSNQLTAVTDVLSNATTYAYNPNGTLKTITDAKLSATNYVYDDFDRLAQTTYPDSTADNFAYDANSNLLSKRTRGGSVINYTYDNLNRLTTKTYPDSTSVVYSYDQASRLTSVTGGAAAISYQYDNLNRVIQTAAAGKTISYEYDALGNRTKLVYPDASFITYQYDNLNRLTGILDQSSATIAGYGYDTLSRRTNVSLANNTQTNYQYDNVNRLVSMANKINGGANISAFSYGYDAVGNRLSKTTAAGQETYGYDNLNQLTSAQYPTGSPFANTGFNYDPLGNRTTVTNGSATTYVSNSLNQYSTVNSNTLNYDTNGNLTSYNGWALSYDFENRLIGATNGTTTASYGFDAFGKRISKTVNGVTTNFLYDGDVILAEYDSSGNILRKYIHSDSIDEPVAMVAGSNTYYYNRDGLVTTSELTDNTGAVVEKYFVDVYGKTIIKDASDNILSQSAIGNRFIFTGRELDIETGLYHYRARAYSPDLGRFLQTDPIGYYDSMNLYDYCYNSPLDYTDPSGLFGKEAIKAIVTKGAYVFKIFKGDLMHDGEHIHVYLRRTKELLARVSMNGEVITGVVPKTALKLMKKAGLIAIGAGIILDVTSGKSYADTIGDTLSGMIDPISDLSSNNFKSTDEMIDENNNGIPDLVEQDQEGKNKAGKCQSK